MGKLIWLLYAVLILCLFLGMSGCTPAAAPTPPYYRRVGPWEGEMEVVTPTPVPPASTPTPAHTLTPEMVEGTKIVEVVPSVPVPPTSTPTPTHTPTPTPEPEKVATSTPTPTVPPTPTLTPTLTATPAPKAEDYVEECHAHLEQGKVLLVGHGETGEGDCREGIRLLQLAIEQATAALELEPGDAEACFCRGMSRRWLEEELNEAIQDLECAVEGLEGARQDEVQAALEELREKVAAPICVSMGLPVFAEGWTEDGQPVNPGTTFPANSTREVWAQWSLANPCGEVAVVKWYHDGELACQHDTELEDWWEWAGSGWTADEEWIELGQWCVSVTIGATLMTEGCFSIE